MLGVILGVAAAAFVVYELVTRSQPTAAQIEAQTREDRAKLAASIWGVNVGGPLMPSSTASQLGIDPQVATHCRLEYGDITAASNWTVSYLGAALPLPQRLQMMLNIIPLDSWPPSARRAYCALVRAS